MIRKLSVILLTLFLLPLLSGVHAEQAVTGVTFHDGWDTVDNNRVFYEIFVGSFSDSDGDGIGDLRGIINRMDYLNDGDPFSGKSLGVEGLWLTPIFPSPSYHKYDVTDYYAVDPAFGTMDDLKDLINACHDRGVKIILDLPINHSGDNCRWYKNFLNAHLMQSSSNIWYDFYSWLPAGSTLPAGKHYIKANNGKLLVEANFADNMPELNFDDPRVRQTVVDVAKYYLDMGVDGFRFDAAKYLYFRENDRNVDFWAWYLHELKQIRPDIYTVAEIWDGEGITDQYAVCVNCFNFFTSQAEGLIAQTAKAGDANKWTAYLEQRLASLKAINPEAMNIPFIANHDTDRAAGYLTAASGQMKVAANLYILSPGSPFIYYGEEIGLRGSRGGANTDANRRLAMFWGDGDTVKDPPGSTYDKQTPYSVKDLYSINGNLYDYYKQLLLIRKANPEIARGEVKSIPLAGTKVGGFTCVWQGSTAAVFHNTTNSFQTIDLAGLTEVTLTEIAAFIGGDEAEAVLDGTRLTIGPQTSVVLRDKP